MKIEIKLAKVFASIADGEQTIESTAGAILAVVKEHNIRSVEKWDEVVKTAYEANGWNVRAGRPVEGEPPKPAVPGTVSNYVSLVRNALRDRVKVTKFDSFTALRVEMAKRGGRDDHRGGSTRGASNDPALPEAVTAEFVGVVIRQPTKPNGALFHDLSAVYVGLPEEHRSVFARQLTRLLHRYMPMANLAQLPAPKKQPALENRKAA
jgi:hypothetical protein